VRGRDAVDSARITAHVIDEVMLVEDETMAGGDNSISNRGVYVESLLHGDNIEFSDIDEPLLEQPRTRSQSRAKEPSQPPMEIEPVVEKKKVAKKPRLPKTGPKRRRAIVHEQTLTDDEEF
jgi:hypothetical protein